MKQNHRNETTENTKTSETKPLKPVKQPKRKIDTKNTIRNDQNKTMHEPAKDRLILHVHLGLFSLRPCLNFILREEGDQLFRVHSAEVSSWECGMKKASIDNKTQQYFYN